MNCRIQSNGIDLTDFGSRGQIRTALLSLKLAEVEWLKQKTTQWPVLLLDEIMAELDLQRRKFLIDYLQDAEQTIMTTTDLHLFPATFTETCEKWTIDSGSVVHARKNLKGFLLRDSGIPRIIRGRCGNLIN